ncbi:MAG: amidohydrolase family protein [bacterium]|nr:amidohydrolase family protein [bacterium]
MNISSVNNLTFGAKISQIPTIKVPANKKMALSEIRLKGYNAIIGGDVYMPSNMLEKHDLLFKDNQLIAIDDYDETKINTSINYVILENKKITPAGIDEHIHINFHDSTEQEIRCLLTRLAKGGLGGVVATTLPGTVEHIAKQIEILNNIMKYPMPNEAHLYGIHLEGPFLNPQKSGIHPPEILMNPSVENYKKLQPQNIKLVTLAPELDSNYELTRYLQEIGVIPSAGHSTASYEQIENSGIKRITHLFNAMSSLHHRDLTISNAGLLNPDITVELIPDGFHVDPMMMNLIMQQKKDDKIVLVSDALPHAGIKEPFVMNGVPIHVTDDWRALNDNGNLAGGMQFLFNLAKKLVDTTSITFQKFIQYASINPAKEMKVENDYKFEVGKSPNFTIWDSETLVPEKTFLA